MSGLENILQTAVFQMKTVQCSGLRSRCSCSLQRADLCHACSHVPWLFPTFLASQRTKVQRSGLVFILPIHTQLTINASILSQSTIIPSYRKRGDKYYCIATILAWLTALFLKDKQCAVLFKTVFKICSYLVWLRFSFKNMLLTLHITGPYILYSVHLTKVSAAVCHTIAVISVVWQSWNKSVD